jgi:DNA-directed RNA polymerase subunit RPC12/RpoP
MMRFNCPSCGAGVSAPEEYAGRSTKCRRCNNPIVVPQPAATRQPSKETPDDVSIKRRTESGKRQFDFSEEQESLRHDREPWFYGYLEKYAKILQILGYVIAVGCAVLAAVGFFRVSLMGMRVSSELGGIGGIGVMAVFLSFLGWVLSLAGVVAALLLWLVGVAAILLAVDAARNIRAMRMAAAAAPIPK